MKVSQAINDAVVRNTLMDALNIKGNANFVQGSNQSYYMIVEDSEGVQRLGEVRFIAGANDEDMTAQEKLDLKILEWNNKKAKTEATKKSREEKAKRDKARREKKAAKEAEAGLEDGEE
jgi:hypothetical protein